MDNRIINRAEVINSLQVSVLRNIPAGDFNPGIGFLVKNITEEKKVDGQTVGDMFFFHKLILYPYSIHADLLKIQLKKLKIKKNNFFF